MRRLWALCALTCLCFLTTGELPAGAHGVARLPQDLTYVAVGDSVTAGWGSPLVRGERRNGYVPQLQRQLMTRGRVELHNFGVPGLTSGQFLFLLDHWPEAAAHVREADLITLSIGGNDIIWTEHQSPGDVLKMREALSKYEANIEQILREIRQLNPRARIFALEVYNPFPPDDARHDGLSEWVHWVNEAIAMAANAHQADVVPTASLFLKHEKEYVNLSEDDIHPNLEGHTRIAEQIAHALYGSFTPLLVQEAEPAPTVLWNGKPQSFAEGVLFENDTVFVAAGRLAELYRDSVDRLGYRLGMWWLRVNGKTVELPAPPLLKDGQAYLPLRAVSEALGAKVFWIAETKTISVMAK